MDFRCHLRYFVVAACLWMIASPTFAQLVPQSAKGVSASQVSALIKRANAAGMMFGSLNARQLGNRIVFDAEFVPNSEKIAWLAHFNVTASKLKSLDDEYRTNGYQREIETSVRVNRRPLYSVVWVRNNDTVEPLTIPAGNIPVTGLADGRLAFIDALMMSFLREHNTAGATLAIARDQRLVYARGFGYADVDRKIPMQPKTELRVASISKSLTGVVVMVLVDRGQLTLEDSVMSILRRGGYRTRLADQRWNDISVRHLLQHTGGWDSETTDDPMFRVTSITRSLKLTKSASAADILRYQLGQPLDFDPGQKFAYSNFGYSVLGRVVEIVMEKPFDRCVAELVLAPCRMHHTRLGKTRLEGRGENEARYYMQESKTYVPFWAILRRGQGGRLQVNDPVPEPYGRWDLEVMDSHGGWVSTAPDLLRLTTSLDSVDRPLVSDAALVQMLAQPLVQDGTRRSSWYGCGWDVRPVSRSVRPLESHTIWHSGALAGTSTLFVRRSDGYSWAVLFNTDKSTNGERLASLIDGRIHALVSSVEVWPDYDLFLAP